MAGGLAKHSINNIFIEFEGNYQERKGKDSSISNKRKKERVRIFRTEE